MTGEDLEPDSLILDPYAGSGTTLIAAVLEGHRAIGIEADPRHVAKARESMPLRLQDAILHADEMMRTSRI